MVSQAKITLMALKEARKHNPGLSDEELVNEGFVDDILNDWYAGWDEEGKSIEDSPCLQPEQFMSFHA